MDVIKINLSDLQLDGSNEFMSLSLAVYFMNLDEYREFRLSAIENYSGIGKKAAIKRIKMPRN